MKKEAYDFLHWQREYLRKHAGELTIDADTHITDTENLAKEVRRPMEATEHYYHGRPISAEELLRQMKLAEVDMSLVWQNPAATVYSDDPQFNYDSLLAANRYIAESARRHPKQLIPAGWTDPNALGIDGAVKLARYCVEELGVGIVKINPAQNKFPINGREVRAVVEAVAETGAIIAFHYGADTPYTPPEGLEEIAGLFPELPFIAVHMGGGGAAYEDSDAMYTASRELGLRRENIRFVESAKRDVHIESDFIAYRQAGEPYSGHIFCGSDAPYGNQLFHFAGYRAMLRAFLRGGEHHDPRLRRQPELFDEAAIQGYLGGNFARFIVQVYSRVLEKQE